MNMFQEINELNTVVVKQRTAYNKKLVEQQRLSGAFRRYINWNGTGDGIRDYLGADLNFIRSWIQNMFIGEMKWENYGKVWVIDHIVPFRMFDIFKEEDLILCWNYRNLMPIFDEDNLKKQGNIFFSFELLRERKDKDHIYQKLYERIKPEVEWMIQYINNYDSKPIV